MFGLHDHLDLSYGEGLRPLPTCSRFAIKIVLSRDVAIDGRHHSAGEPVDVTDDDGVANDGEFKAKLITLVLDQDWSVGVVPTQ